MNPLLDALRGPVGYVDPLTRARLAGAAAEQRELQQAEWDRQAAAERFQANLQQQEAVERAEIARDGYTAREMREHRQQQEAARAERRAELEAELARLDPARHRQVQRNQASLTDSDLLRRAKAAGQVSPAVQRMFDAFDAAEAARARAKADLAISRAERDGHRPRGEISR